MPNSISDIPNVSVDPKNTGSSFTQSQDSLHELWQTSPVAELKPFLVDNHVYGSFELIPGLAQIFSLNPSDDYEVDEYTIAGWKLVYDTENALSAEYFSALKKLQPFIIDTQNGSILLRVDSIDDIAELLS